MTDRIPITDFSISETNFSSHHKYFLRGFGGLKLEENDDLISLDIDLFVGKGGLTLINMANLTYLSERIILQKDEIFITGCPLLKTLPNNLIVGQDIYFNNNQHLITIFSEKQFNSLNRCNIDVEKFVRIKTYEEYYSLIEPTLIKNNLMKICNL